jgi:hypothetical protein
MRVCESLFWKRNEEGVYSRHSTPVDIGDFAEKEVIQ